MKSWFAYFSMYLATTQERLTVKKTAFERFFVVLFLKKLYNGNIHKFMRLFK